jgi:uncharacterized protein YjbJ (UPF0337 family)
MRRRLSRPLDLGGNRLALHDERSAARHFTSDSRTRGPRRAKEDVVDKDEIKGKVEQAKGWVKDKAGEMTGNPDLEAEGEAQRVAGKVQETYGKAKDAVKKAADSASDKS